MSVAMRKHACRLVSTIALLAVAPLAVAAKPTKPGGGGGGETPDPCLAANLVFPAFSHVILRYSNSTGYQNEVRLADATGACSVLVEVVGGGGGIPPAFAPILIKLDDGWRLAWSNVLDSIEVRDFTVSVTAGQRPSVVLDDQATIDLSGQRAFGIDAMPDGGFVYFVRPEGYLAPVTIYRAVQGVGGAWTTTALAWADPSKMYLVDLAVAPAGDSVFYAYAAGNDHRVSRLPLGPLPGTLPVELDGPEDPSELVAAAPIAVFGAAQKIAAGPCEGIPGGTCLALALQGPNTDPCVPYYWRTLAWDSTNSPAPDLATLPKLQLANPSFRSDGKLLGQLTGSTSKRACTAKVYDTIVLQSPFDAGSATILGTGQVPDAPF